MFDQNQRPTSPATTHGAIARRTVRRTALGVGRRVVVLGALVATLVAGTAGTAQAWSYDLAQGSAGSVSLPRINVSDTYLYVGGIAVATLTIDSTIGPLVYRSPATTGAQDVYAVYSLQRWNGSAWATQAQGTASARIGAGYGSVRMPRASFMPTSGKGYYRVAWAFAWKVPGASANLGSGVLNANSTSDFACITPLRPCQVSAGYVRAGRLYQLGGGW